MLPNKYWLYEHSVQSTDVHVEFFSSLCLDLSLRRGLQLREDFCGTFKLCADWVKKDPEHTALGIDLDPEPLAYGKANHWAKLTANQKKRISLRKANVLVPTPPKNDIIVACNFSFFIFKKRDVLLNYFKSCLKSLKKDGLLVLELAGGPGMIAKGREQKTLTYGKRKFTYIWDQRSFNPITHDALYSIHFKFPDGTFLKDAFVYDWRLWTIPELRDLLEEAGFSQNHAYWETSHEGEGTGEYVKSDKADNDYSWITYVVGVR